MAHKRKTRAFAPPLFAEEQSDSVVASTANACRPATQPTTQPRVSQPRPATRQRRVISFREIFLKRRPRLLIERPPPPPPPKRRRLRKKRKERKGSTREKVSSRLFLDSIVEKAHLDRWLGIAPCCCGRRRESLFERGEVPLQDRQRLLLQRWLSSADSFIGGVCGS
jgi:hypothetical protein